ncbi:MAG: hypothetical protein N4A74_12670 [Carboxylicivirga sp.]|jgi:hypothetical protein|nr:hypothetical protein [Carboxylicivirga sp.]
MNEVVKIVHKSRTVEYTLNFPANGVTAWAITADGDGAFYDVRLNNVASFQIAGITEALPFLVTSGKRYTIGITKTTIGQTASITLIQRRQTNKTLTTAVPDFGQFNGRYLYALMGSGTEVKKIDTSLLLASNYEGVGVWTTNPVVATITLPTLVSGAAWSSLTFVKQGNIPRMILHTVDADTNQAHFCTIRLSDDLVFNLDFSTQNGYNTHPLIVLGNTSPAAVYDFVNEIVYFNFNQSGSTFNPVVSLDLTDNTITDHLFNSFVHQRFSESISRRAVRPFKFIPDLQRWSQIGDFSFIENRYYNYKPAGNAGSWSSYQLSRGTTDRTQGSISTKDLLDSGGQLIVRLSTTFLAEFGTDESYTMDSAGYIMTVEDAGYSFIDYQSASPTHKAKLGTMFGSDTNAYRSLIGSNLNAHFYARTGNTTSHGQRIIVFDPSQATPEIAYLDLGAAINQLHTDQLVI